MGNACYKKSKLSSSCFKNLSLCAGDCSDVVCDVDRYNQVCYHGMCVCQDMCPMTIVDEDKVCGSDDVTYDSVCHLKMAACKAQSDLSVQYYGPCDEDGEYNQSSCPTPTFTQSDVNPFHTRF